MGQKICRKSRNEAKRESDEVFVVYFVPSLLCVSLEPGNLLGPNLMNIFHIIDVMDANMERRSFCLLLPP